MASHKIVTHYWLTLREFSENEVAIGTHAWQNPRFVTWSNCWHQKASKRQKIRPNIGSVAKLKKREECSGIIKTLEFVQVLEIIDEDPTTSMRTISRKFNVSEIIIHLIVLEDLHYKSYIMCRRQFISAQTRDQRLIRSKHLLNKLKHPKVPSMLHFFSDEKKFNQDQKRN